MAEVGDPGFPKHCPYAALFRNAAGSFSKRRSSYFTSGQWSTVVLVSARGHKAWGIIPWSAKGGWWGTLLLSYLFVMWICGLLRWGGKMGDLLEAKCMRCVLHSAGHNFLCLWLQCPYEIGRVCFIWGPAERYQHSSAEPCFETLGHQFLNTAKHWRHMQNS